MDELAGARRNYRAESVLYHFLDSMRQDIGQRLSNWAHL